MNQNELNPIRVSLDIVLKPLEPSDAVDIFNTIDSQRDYLGKWLPFVKYTKVFGDTEAFVKMMIEPHFEEREHTFVIQYKGVFAGLIGYVRSDRSNKKTEIGYWLSEGFQRKGIITDSVKALLGLAYNELGFNRVQIKCAVGNVRSKKIPHRLGFKLEGIERDGELLNEGDFTDIEIYSKLKNDK